MGGNLNGIRRCRNNREMANTTKDRAEIRLINRIAPPGRTGQFGDRDTVRLWKLIVQETGHQEIVAPLPLRPKRDLVCDISIQAE